MKSSTAVGKSTAPTAVALLGQFDRVSPPSVTVVTASVVAARFLTTTACAVRLLATPRFPPTFKSPARAPPGHARVNNHKTIMQIFIVRSFRVRSSRFGGAFERGSPGPSSELWRRRWRRCLSVGVSAVLGWKCGSRSGSGRESDRHTGRGKGRSAFGPVDSSPFGSRSAACNSDARHIVNFNKFCQQLARHIFSLLKTGCIMILPP